jgi:predicted lipoprotein with Yx(FWY)xxD motif
VSRGAAGRGHRVPRWPGVLVPAALVTVVLAGGCTSSGTAVSSPFTSTRPVLERGPTYQVKVQDVNGLGPVLVDGQGIALYLFGNDRRGAPSRCYDICAIQWPPALLPDGVSRPVAGPGVTPSLLGTATRTDGTTQITYNGWPLYFWPPDRTPGTATGQALTNAGGRWYVVDAAGDAVVTK